MNVMVFDLFDRDHLVRVGSPLLKMHDDIVRFPLKSMLIGCSYECG
jgi:hypothetical protein